MTINEHSTYPTFKAHLKEADGKPGLWPFETNFSLMKY